MISTKLDAAARKNFLDKMMSKIKSWSTKKLSYAGRVQLIKSVLFSVKMYWSGLFILPKRILYNLEQLLS